MGVREINVISAKFKNRWVKINLEAVKESMKNIYKITKKKDLNLALINIRDFHRDDEDLQKEAGFISKLIQLEASGYVEPIINLARLYQEIVSDLTFQERRKNNL